jgi:NADP-reducing hydrogenase subunit HndB
MKSIADLEKIRQATMAKANIGEGAKGPRIVVGMATCGIAAGARPVMAAINDEVAKLGLQNVVVSQTGCIGMCQYEPLIEVTLPGQAKITYVKVNPDMIPRIVNEHVAGGEPIEEYTVGAVAQ